MKLHIWIWGLIGAGVAVVLGLAGMNIAPQANLGCLASLLIPLVVGFMAAHASAASGAHGAVDGGLAAGIAAMVGGGINLLTGCAMLPGQLAATGPIDLLGWLAPGLVILAFVYFLHGFVVGIVALSLRSTSKSNIDKMSLQSVSAQALPYMRCSAPAAQTRWVSAKIFVNSNIHSSGMTSYTSSMSSAASRLRVPFAASKRC